MSKQRFEGSELLHAYVDGELTLPERERVEQWLETHPEDANRVAEWQKQNDGLQALFAAKADEAIPEHLLSGEQPLDTGYVNSHRYSVLSYVAAAILFLTIGSLGGWFGHDYIKQSSSSSGLKYATTEKLTTHAMEAHWVYTPEVRHPVEVNSNEQAHLAKWLSYRLEAPLTIPDLSTSGFQLMGGRLLPSSTGPAAQFMYESKEGSRITVYLSKLDTKTQTQDPKANELAFQFQKTGTTQAFYWYDGPLGYAVIGDIEHKELSNIADQIYRQL